MKIKEILPTFIQNIGYQRIPSQVQARESMNKRVKEWLQRSNLLKATDSTQNLQTAKCFTSQHFEDIFKWYENLSNDEASDFTNLTDAILNSSVGGDFLMQALEAFNDTSVQESKIQKARLVKIHHIAIHAVKRDFQLSSISEKLKPVLDNVNVAHMGKLAKLCEALFQKNEGGALLDKAFEIYAKTRNETHCEVVENIMICALQNNFQISLIENTLSEAFDKLNWCQAAGARLLYANLFQIKLGREVLMKALAVIDQASKNILSLNDEAVVSATLIIRAALQADFCCEQIKGTLKKNASKEVLERYFTAL